MNNPQKEHGHLQLATGAPDNDLLMALVRAALHGSEYQIALFVLRKTWGYGKKKDRISLSQFQKGTGLARSTVCHAINTLVARKILVAQRGLPITEYSFNKQFNQWVVAYMQLVAHTGLELVAQDDSASSMDGTQLVAQDGHTKETLTKDIYTKESDLEKNKGERTNTTAEEKRKEISEWSDAEIEKLGKDFLRLYAAFTDEHYAKKTWDQRVNLRSENRIEFYRKCLYFCSRARIQTDKSQCAARILQGEIAGFINDRGAMEKVLDGKEAAKRRELILEGLQGQDDGTLNVSPTTTDDEIF